MSNYDWIVQKFNEGASVEWLAGQAYLSAKGSGEKTTRKKARNIVEQAIYEHQMKMKRTAKGA